MLTEPAILSLPELHYPALKLSISIDVAQGDTLTHTSGLWMAGETGQEAVSTSAKNVMFRGIVRHLVRPTLPSSQQSGQPHSPMQKR